jgi:hypothetical protein
VFFNKKKTKTIIYLYLAQADLENARNFLAKAAEQNLVCQIFLIK